jgi:hypothetical protein
MARVYARPRGERNQRQRARDRANEPMPAARLEEGFMSALVKEDEPVEKSSGCEDLPGDPDRDARLK